MKLSLSDTAFNAAVFAYDKSLSGSAVVQPRPMHAVHVIALRAALEAALAAAGTESLYGHKPGCPPAPAACICASGTEPTREQIEGMRKVDATQEARGGYPVAVAQFAIDAYNQAITDVAALFRAPIEAKPEPDQSDKLAHRLGLIHDVICSEDTRDEAFDSIRAIMLGQCDHLLRMIK